MLVYLAIAVVVFTPIAIVTLSDIRRSTDADAYRAAKSQLSVK